METRFLHTFVLVVEASSITEAARQLNVTPSAVIQRIRALEDEVGCELIHRAGHAMRPTAAGAAILERARQMVGIAQDIAGIGSGDLEAGELRLGVITTAVTGLLPDVLVSVKRNRPKIEVYMLPGISADLYRKTMEGELDAAILVKPHFKLPKTMAWLPLRLEPLIVLTPAAMTESDPRLILTREPFIRYDRNHWGGRLADRCLRRLRINPREQFELDSLEAISVLVDRGLGVSLIPDWPAPWPHGISVRKVAIPGAPVREIGLVWPRASARLRLTEAFIQEIRAVLPPPA